VGARRKASQRDFFEITNFGSGKRVILAYLNIKDDA